MDGGSGDDLLLDNSPPTTMFGDAGNDSLFGGGGSDFLDGGDGLDTVQGGEGNDTLVSTAGADLLYGSEGNDTFTINSLVSLISGGAGEDTVTLFNGAVIASFDPALNDGNEEPIDFDTLILEFDLGALSQGEIDALLDAIAAAIESTALTGGGTITIGAVTYTWRNYEALIDLITFSLRQDEDGDDGLFVRLRLNYLDVDAPAAIYCAADGTGIEVWDIGAGGQGTLAFLVLNGQILNGETLMGLGDSLTGLGSGSAQVVAPYDYPGAPPLPPYTFDFNLSACAGNAGAQLN